MIYEGKIKDGNILVAVHTNDAAQVDAAKKLFEQMGVKDVHATTEASLPSSDEPETTNAASPHM